MFITVSFIVSFICPWRNLKKVSNKVETFFSFCIWDCFTICRISIQRKQQNTQYFGQHFTSNIQVLTHNGYSIYQTEPYQLLFSSLTSIIRLLYVDARYGTHMEPEFKIGYYISHLKCDLFNSQGKWQDIMILIWHSYYYNRW